MSRVIKRYENRKMYDTENRKYISLEEIANLVRQGVDIKVIDKKTEDDITAQTLTQVILEEGKKGRNPLSTEMLHDVLRWSNSVIDDGLQQVRERLDQFIPGSLNTIFSGNQDQNEMDHLKKRIEDLEGIIQNLADQAKTESTNKKKSTNTERNKT